MVTPTFDERRYLIPFRSSLLPQIFCDTLIIGTGVAGLRAALAAALHGEVILISKSEVTRSSTAWAQGGVAAVLDLEPSHIASHVEDTLEAGAGLCDVDAVMRVVEGAKVRVEELLSWGMQVDLDSGGRVAFGLEGGHHEPRILHSHGDATGKELVRCLLEKVRQTPSIRVFDNCFALDLLSSEEFNESAIRGAITFHPEHRLQIIWSAATIIATGGTGQVYRETTNPAVVTGDGLAMAYRAGADIADMAFVQFHPTTLYVAGAERSLISEAVRGEGAYLIDRRGHRFMVGRHEMAELAPRDVVSRCIVQHLVETGDTHVFLDCRHFKRAFFAERFPSIAAQLTRFEINPERDLIPVNPSAHYAVGGIQVDGAGRTNLKGLYAVGEVSCTGLHGANRLASNSLLEGLVNGEIAGRMAQERRENGNGGRHAGKIVSEIPTSLRGELDLADVRSSLRSVMWKHLGVIRDGNHIADVREMIDFWGRYTLDKVFENPAGWEVQNMLSVASMICNSARWRHESRGTHYRVDFPETHDEYLVHDLWMRGRPEPVLLPVRSRGSLAGTGTR